MLFLLDLILEILEVGLIEVEVGGLVFQHHSLMDGEDRSPFCRQTLLHLSILLGSREGKNLVCGKGRRVYLFIYLFGEDEFK